MAMIEINTNPSRRELWVFGGLLVIFFAAVGGLVIWRPAALIGAAVFLSTALAASLIFNANRRRQLLGVLIPGLFTVLVGAVNLGLPARSVALPVWVLGLVGGLVAWTSPAAARRLYVLWMFAVAPVGWTVSQVILGVVYYAVLTPVGLAMRLVGYDPMKRHLDRAARSYWIERRASADPSRYFRQF